MTQKGLKSMYSRDNQAAISLGPWETMSLWSLSKFLEHLPQKFCKQTILLCLNDIFRVSSLNIQVAAK